MHHKSKSLLACLLVLLTSFATICFQHQKPVLYIIGDSTVRNGDGSGNNGQWGWGSFVAAYFDTAKISVRNHAIEGRSSRTLLRKDAGIKSWQN